MGFHLQKQDQQGCGLLLRLNLIMAVRGRQSHVPDIVSLPCLNNGSNSSYIRRGVCYIRLTQNPRTQREKDNRCILGKYDYFVRLYCWSSSVGGSPNHVARLQSVRSVTVCVCVLASKTEQNFLCVHGVGGNEGGLLFSTASLPPFLHPSIPPLCPLTGRCV